MWVVLVAQLLLSCLILRPVSVESQQAAVVQQVRHSLVGSRAESLFGSSQNGSCTSSVMGQNLITYCNGTSVLDDGVTPVLSGVSNDTNSMWAEQLFTMMRPGEGIGRIIMSFELEDATHNRVELSVFNCPEFWINTPQAQVYFDTSFRPERSGPDRGEGVLDTTVPLSDTSCNYLIKFCISYSPGAVPTRFVNLEFPFVDGTNTNRVFVGEVEFLNGGGSPCGPPELITNDPTTGDVTNGIDTSTTAVSHTSPRSDVAVIIGAVTAVLVLACAVVVAVVVVVLLCMKTRKRKGESFRIRQFQDVVMETKEEEKEAESYMDGLGNYEVVDRPQKNGFRVPENDTILDVLYSDPNQPGYSFYSHLREGEKQTVQTADIAGEEYSELDVSQVGKKSANSPPPQSLMADNGEMYAVPDKSKKKSKLPVVPEKSTELINYLDTKDMLSRSYSQHSSSNTEYSEIGGPVVKRSGSVGPVPLTNSASQNLVANLNSNPIYQSTEILPGLSNAGSPQHEYSGVLDIDAIYSEPGPPTIHEPEWNPDQNIYDSVYNEPLQPSLFMEDRGMVEEEELHPYSSIYTVPNVPAASEKPLTVTMANIKEIKCLGDGNFGKVILALTVGLSKQDLKLEGDATHTLVAVKKLKDNPSEMNRQIFGKEVKFMSRLNHPNVIRLLGVCTEGKTPFIMMEYMKNGDLNQYIKEFHSIGEGDPKSISGSRLVYISTQIASAMHYLASQNFIHRDLATRNCLVGSKDTIKIADFGMSRSLYESQYYVISGHAILPIRWMATECFYGKFSAKTDVWAFGVTMWEIFTLGKVQPYSSLTDGEVVADAIKGQDRTLLERPTDCPEDIYEIMRQCWAIDASQRPTFDELHGCLSNR